MILLDCIYVTFYSNMVHKYLQQNQHWVDSPVGAKNPLFQTFKHCYYEPSKALNCISF